MSTPQRVGILFGGRSAEHEVSVRSARSVREAVSAGGFTPVPIGITKSGAWRTGDEVAALLDGDSQAKEVGETHGARLPPPELLENLDIVFPVLHGPYGEDGTVQGLFELADVPYVGAGVAASALAMDKALFKDVMQANGFSQTSHLVVFWRNFSNRPDSVVEQIEMELEYPLFVKPANMGSSVGISKCRDAAELRAGVEDAARYDRKIIVEQAVRSPREIEVAVLGNDKPEATLPGEVVASRDFYSYEAKYEDEGDAASKLHVPADLPAEVQDAIRHLAIDVYNAIDCAGMARIDFLMDGETEAVLVNEVNTIPGFTSISLFPRMWKERGLSYDKLVARLIELGLERHEARMAPSTQ